MEGRDQEPRLRQQARGAAIDVGLVPERADEQPLESSTVRSRRRIAS